MRHSRPWLFVSKRLAILTILIPARSKMTVSVDGDECDRLRCMEWVLSLSRPSALLAMVWEKLSLFHGYDSFLGFRTCSMWLEASRQSCHTIVEGRHWSLCN